MPDSPAGTSYDISMFDDQGTTSYTGPLLFDGVSEPVLGFGPFAPDILVNEQVTPFSYNENIIDIWIEADPTYGPILLDPTLDWHFRIDNLTLGGETPDFIGMNSLTYTSLFTGTDNWLDSNFSTFALTGTGAPGDPLSVDLTTSYGAFGGDLPEALHISLYTGYVPVPAAIWLFGSGLLGLIGVARRMNNA